MRSVKRAIPGLIVPPAPPNGTRVNDVHFVECLKKRVGGGRKTAVNTFPRLVLVLKYAYLDPPSAPSSQPGPQRPEGGTDYEDGWEESPVRTPSGLSLHMALS